jgi:hypothetical protein
MMCADDSRECFGAELTLDAQPGHPEGLSLSAFKRNLFVRRSSHEPRREIAFAQTVSRHWHPSGKLHFRAGIPGITPNESTKSLRLSSGMRKPRKRPGGFVLRMKPQTAIIDRSVKKPVYGVDLSEITTVHKKQ